MKASYEFKPINVGRWLIWGIFAVLLLVAPQLFTSSLAITILSQIGIAIIACLSFNILLGQGGMLSFGHAVYTGLGAYLAIHALNAIEMAGIYPFQWCPLWAALRVCVLQFFLGLCRLKNRVQHLP